MARSAIIGIYVAVSVAALGAAFYIYKPFESNMVRACEKVLIGGLKVPSGYERISVEEKTVPIAISTWRATRRKHTAIPISAEEALRIAKDMEAKGSQPAWLVVYIEYDAPNAFNARIRSNVDCMFLSRDGSDRGVNTLNIFFNGENMLGDRFDGKQKRLSEMSCLEIQRLNNSSRILSADERRDVWRRLDQCK